MADEQGWVIERYINSDLRYWAGLTCESFSSESEKAIRFSRAEGAARVLAWLLNGQGRVVQHLWVRRHA